MCFIVMPAFYIEFAVPKTPSPSLFVNPSLSSCLPNLSPTRTRALSRFELNHALGTLLVQNSPHAVIARDDRVLAEYDARAAVAALVCHAVVVAARAGRTADGGGAGVGLGGPVVFAGGHFFLLYIWIDVASWRLYGCLVATTVFFFFLFKPNDFFIITDIMIFTEKFIYKRLLKILTTLT